VAKVEFYYPDIDDVDIPEKNLLGIYQCQPFPVTDESQIKTMIAESLDRPCGVPPLGEILKPGHSVLILSDDNTRETPVHLILEVLLPRLHGLGIPKERIGILMALGTHRPMTPDELTDKLGSHVVENYQVSNHQWKNAEDNVCFGRTSAGIDVWGNKQLKAYDIIIGLGHIVPHRVAGFSGGGKIAQPGVSSGGTTGETHWQSALIPGDDIIGKRDNPVRKMIDESAELMGLDLILNVVQDVDRNVVGSFFGHPVAAHRQGCKLAETVYGISIPKADIVIADAYPADLELWQAAKGIYSCEPVVKENGVVILVSPCREGVSTSHQEIERLGYHSLSGTLQLIESGQIKDLTVAAHLVHVGRVITEKATGILVSPGINDKTTQKLGFIPAKTPQAALSVALEKMGPDAAVAVMLHAGEILPQTYQGDQ